MSTKSAPIVFLDQRYSYRNAWVGLFLAIFGGMAGLMVSGLVAWLLEFPAKLAAGKAAWWEPLVASVSVAPFVGFACYLAWLFFVRPRWQVRIDERGITFGHQFFGWERIAWIGVKPAGQMLNWRFGYYPAFHLRSRWPLVLDRGLPVSPSLTTQQAEEMLDRLDEYLNEKYPEVEVG